MIWDDVPYISPLKLPTGYKEERKKYKPLLKGVDWTTSIELQDVMNKWGEEGFKFVSNNEGIVMMEKTQSKWVSFKTKNNG